MKKIIYAVAALAAVLVSCSKMTSDAPVTSSERIPGVKYESLTIRSASDTKTALNEDHTSCVWSEGDRFVVYSPYEATYAANTFESKDNGKGLFSGEVPEGTTSIKAVYAGSTSCEGSVISVVIPSEQKAVAAGAFDPEAHVSVASASRVPGQDVELTFRTLNRFVKVRVLDDQSKVVKLSLKGEVSLSGKFALTDGMEMGSVQDDASTSVSLVPAEGEFIAPGDYYICVAPVDLAGFSLVYTFSDGSTYTRTSANTLDMATSKAIRNLTISEVPVPTVTAVDGFYSSYDLYLQGEVAAANAQDRFALVNGSVIATFPEGWANVKYGYQLDGNNVEGLTATVSETGSVSLKGVVFAGGRTFVSEASLTRIITGLPYRYAFSSQGVNYSQTSTQAEGWTLNTVSAMSSQLALSVNQRNKVLGFVSKSFVIPEELNVECTAELKYYRAALSVRNTTIYGGAAENGTTRAADAILKLGTQEFISSANSTDGYEDLRTVKGDVVMTPSKPFFTITSSGLSGESVIGIPYAEYLYLHNVSLKYK